MTTIGPIGVGPDGREAGRGAQGGQNAGSGCRDASRAALDRAHGSYRPCRRPAGPSGGIAAKGTGNGRFDGRSGKGCRSHRAFVKRQCWDVALASRPWRAVERAGARDHHRGSRWQRTERQCLRRRRLPGPRELRARAGERLEVPRVRRPDDLDRTVRLRRTITLTRESTKARRPLRDNGPSWSQELVSRVLSSRTVALARSAIIPLVRTSPFASSSQPVGFGRAALMIERLAPFDRVHLRGLAPGGVCLATPVTERAVGSYPAISPLPRRSSRFGGAVCFLWHSPRGHPHRALPGTLLCGARTFLPRRPQPKLRPPPAIA